MDQHPLSEHADWIRDYEQHERDPRTPPRRIPERAEEMSRSNPTDAVRNPSTRWFEWSGGHDGGFVRWYDKEAKVDVKVEPPFTFLLLDELSTVKGWHEASESGIYANEVRDTRQVVLVVKSFKGGELASGLYADIRDRVAAIGGYYCASLYVAFKDGADLRLGNLVLKGVAAGAWMEFKRNAPTKKTPDGKSVRAFYVDAVRIASFEEGKKGKVVFRTPVFSLATVSEETNQQAAALDAELQGFLIEYLKRPKAEAAAKPQGVEEPATPPEQRAPEPALNGRAGTATDPAFEDDIPF
jgi:hypothetical protein